MIQVQHQKKFFTKRVIKRIISILILLVCIIVFFYPFRTKYVLTKNMWYTSNITKTDNSPLEQYNYLLGEIYEFKKDGLYTIYKLQFPSILLRNKIYYGNERYYVTIDSLILDDYKRAKILSISKDSIVFRARTNYSYLDDNNNLKGITTMLKYTLKPIYARRIYGDTLKRRKQSSSYIIID